VASAATTCTEGTYYSITSHAQTRLSDADEDVSPSQYRKDMVRKDTADQYLDDEVEDDDEEQEHLRIWGCTKVHKVQKVHTWCTLEHKAKSEFVQTCTD
jgi:hypothetical protein